MNHTLICASQSVDFICEVSTSWLLCFQKKIPPETEDNYILTLRKPGFFSLLFQYPFFPSQILVGISAYAVCRTDLRYTVHQNVDNSRIVCYDFSFSEARQFLKKTLILSYGRGFGNISHFDPCDTSLLTYFQPKRHHSNFKM